MTQNQKSRQFRALITRNMKLALVHLKLELDKVDTQQVLLNERVEKFLGK